MRGECPQKTLLHRRNGIGTNQPPTIRCNHVDGADFGLRDPGGGRHFRVKETQIVQRRAPLAPPTVGFIVAKFNDAASN